MSVQENMALVRRVEILEREILAVEPRRFQTVFRVVKRGNEPRCRDAAHVHELAALDPVVEVVGEHEDLDILIDAEAGARIQRAANDTSFDELAAGVEITRVVITCYPEQLRQILSDAPITATTGGTQAGKTRVLVWWMFRQWLLRGHGVDEDHEVVAVGWWIREDSEKLFKHGVKWLLRLWPDVFVGKLPTETTKNPSLHLFDGSRIDFRHAHHSGQRSGTNLRSESIAIGIVVDELSAILHEENWRELKSRVSKTGAPIATAFTPTRGHWSSKLAKQAPNSGGAIVVRRLTMFDNPYWSYACMWVDLLKDGAVTATELEEKILSADDPVAAALEVVTDPHTRRMRFGEEMSIGATLWALWDSDTMIHRGREPRAEFERGGLGRPRSETAEILPNITGRVFGKHFGQPTITRAGGKDFNTSNGVTVMFRVFGDPRRPLVYVFDELANAGPTIVNAEAVAAKYPGLCIFCDPTGALSGRHASHGSSNTTDAEEVRIQGLKCEPANGWTGGKGSGSRHVAQLPQIDSINVMHRAMRLGLLLVHPRCTGVIEAMTDMQSKPDGTIQKTSAPGSRSDRISDYGDALRYGVWQIWRHFLTAEAKVHR